MMPSETNCTVVISGNEDEVLELAAAHAVTTHGHTDGPDLRESLRGMLRDEEELTAEAGSFVQLVEFHAHDLDRFHTMVDEWRQKIGQDATARWAMLAADRDRPDTFVEVVGFPDFASAMRNSDHPATAEFAKRMQEATEGEAGFRNLDVREVMRM
jgi:hypothetical protein